MYFNWKEDVDGVSTSNGMNVLNTTNSHCAVNGQSGARVMSPNSFLSIENSRCQRSQENAGSGEVGDDAISDIRVEEIMKVIRAAAETRSNHTFAFGVGELVANCKQGGRVDPSIVVKYDVVGVLRCFLSPDFDADAIIAAGDLADIILESSPDSVYELIDTEFVENFKSSMPLLDSSVVCRILKKIVLCLRRLPNCYSMQEIFNINPRTGHFDEYVSLLKAIVSINSVEEPELITMMHILTDIVKNHLKHEVSRMSEPLIIEIIGLMKDLLKQSCDSKVLIREGACSGVLNDIFMHCNSEKLFIHGAELFLEIVSTKYPLDKFTMNLLLEKSADNVAILTQILQILVFVFEYSSDETLCNINIEIINSFIQRCADLSLYSADVLIVTLFRRILQRTSLDYIPQCIFTSIERVSNTENEENLICLTDLIELILLRSPLSSYNASIIIETLKVLQELEIDEISQRSSSLLSTYF